MPWIFQEFKFKFLFDFETRAWTPIKFTRLILCKKMRLTLVCTDQFLWFATSFCSFSCKKLNWVLKCTAVECIWGRKINVIKFSGLYFFAGWWKWLVFWLSQSIWTSATPSSWYEATMISSLFSFIQSLMICWNRKLFWIGEATARVYSSEGGALI